MNQPAQPPVQHDLKAQRFFIEAAPGLVCELDYVLTGRQVNFVHTGVPAALQGQGLAARLVEAGIRWARTQQLEVRAGCSYVQAWLRKHPQPAD